MSRYGLFLLLASAWAWCGGMHATVAAGGLQVDERAIIIHWHDDHCLLQLPFHNLAGENLALRAEAELLDPQDGRCGHVTVSLTASPGRNTWTAALRLQNAPLEKDHRAWFPTLRLHYRLSVAGDRALRQEGRVSLAATTANLFTLRSNTPDICVRAGRPFMMTVQTFQPLSTRAVAEVEVEATLVSGEEPQPLARSRGTTDNRGIAVLSLDVPAEATYGSQAVIRITARKGDVERSLDHVVMIWEEPLTIFSTDKPLYQPGQTVHARILCFDADRQALTRWPLVFRVRDRNWDEVFRWSATTSDQGIATMDWPIPAECPQGRFNVEVFRQSDENLDDAIAFLSVWVSRYELPQFAVQARPDRPYYHPSETARVDIRADYMFGRPVPNAPARLTRLESRYWDFSTQHWVTREGFTVEGTTDAGGLFVAEVPVDNLIEDDDFGWNRQYQDRTLMAEVTDPSTGRRETRRFDLRLTEHDIHIYLMEGVAPLADDDLTGTCYLTAFYADGRPAECNIVVMSVPDTRYSLANQEKYPDLVVETVHTNAYGVARVSTLRDDHLAEGRIIRFYARDAAGRWGVRTEQLWLNKQVHIETGQTIYRAGEPVKARIHAPADCPAAMVLLLAGERILASRVVNLRPGGKEVVFHYDPSWQGILTLMACPLDPGTERGAGPGKRMIVFPTTDEEMMVDLDTGPDEFRPGQEMDLRVSVHTRDGRPVTATVGLTAVDRGVFDRARQEADCFDVSADSFFRDAIQYSGKEQNLGSVNHYLLEHLHPGRRLPAGLDLAAEALLASDSYCYTKTEVEEGAPDNVNKLFKSWFTRQMAPLRRLLEARIDERQRVPGTVADIARLWDDAGLNVTDWRDPWDRPYRFFLEPERDRLFFRLCSAGPDEIPDTTDDLDAFQISWRYFTPHGHWVDQAAQAYLEREQAPLHDLTTLKAELRRRGQEFDDWRDPWGQSYTVDFMFHADTCRLRVLSQGPPANRPYRSSITAWRTEVQYFDPTRRRILRALDAMHQAGVRITAEMDSAEITAALGLPRDALADVWGQPYVFIPEIKRDYQVIPYDLVDMNLELASLNLKQPQFLLVKSAGPDGQPETKDDFFMARIPLYLLTLEHCGATGGAAAGSGVSNLTGTIEGLVVDETGAIVPGVTVTARLDRDGAQYSVYSDETGRFLFKNMPPGDYTVATTLEGFQPVMIINVPVQAGKVTPLKLVLFVGSMACEVLCIAESEVVVTTTSCLDGVTKKDWPQRRPLQTPRVRRYFPETLLWEPALATGATGKARLRVPLADSLTTWRIMALASTVDGQIAWAEKDITTFQPFFVDQELPPCLTAGDELQLPVVVRNYAAEAQSVQVTLRADPEFKSLGPEKQILEVPGDGFGRREFAVRAGEMGEAAGVVVEARAMESGDAVARTTAIRPDGLRVDRCTGTLLRERVDQTVDIPAEVIPGTIRAELRLYPRLTDHVRDNVEGMLRRPWGCGEQTVSAVYPSLMVLRLQEQDQRPPDRWTARAGRYLEEGFHRLKDFQTPTGGFGYWSGAQNADVALTAYILQFLADAAPYFNHAGDMIPPAVDWLLQQQQPGGFWSARRHGSRGADSRDTALTAGVYRLLGWTLRDRRTSPRPNLENRGLEDCLQRAKAFLSVRIRGSQDPYVLAQYALAALERGDRDGARQSLDRLRKLARRQDDTCYWEPALPTPFYGWGGAARCELTALALLALARSAEGSSLTDERLTMQALQFLLQQKDRLGGWWSTQATVAVLEALLYLDRGTAADGAAWSVTVQVDDQPVTVLDSTVENGTTSPYTLDLTSRLVPGVHRLVLERTGGVGTASVQLVSRWYVPWEAESAVRRIGRRPLSFTVDFQQTAAKVGEAVTCHVRAGRCPDGSGEDCHSWGMLVGEIGLPPGAEVDRVSLDQAVARWDSGLFRYDVLPDRIHVYLWPTNGDAVFDFTFRPRLGLRAKTPPCRLVDYYNPDLEVILPPVTFQVQAVDEPAAVMSGAPGNDR